MLEQPTANVLLFSELLPGDLVVITDEIPPCRRIVNMVISVDFVLDFVRRRLLLNDGSLLIQNPFDKQVFRRRSEGYFQVSVSVLRRGVAMRCVALLGDEIET